MTVDDVLVPLNVPLYASQPDSILIVKSYALLTLAHKECVLCELLPTAVVYKDIEVLPYKNNGAALL